MICAHKKYPEALSNYRVDRIVNIQCTQRCTPYKFIKDLDVNQYIAERVYMYGGETMLITMRAKRFIIKDILDWFGNQVRMEELDEDHILCHVKAKKNAILLWALQYAIYVEVLSPQSLRDEVIRGLSDAQSNYQNGNRRS